MSITVKPTHTDFVTEISGVDLARPLKPADRDAIEDAINRYAIVVFHDQKLTDEQQIDFARHFGPIHSSAQKARHTGIKHPIASTDIADISNLDGDGNLLAPDNKRRLDGLANRLWHTDASFRAVPGALSMLYAHVVPDEGGDTEFADLRAAYDALPDKTKKQLDGLIAEHSIWHSRGQLAVTTYTPEERASLPPVPQRVVRSHPDSGRKTLYVAAHASHIIGMPIADGRLLLMDLIEHATQRRFVHAHTWKQGDLVIWYNRCTMHRARPFDTTPIEPYIKELATSRELPSFAVALCALRYPDSGPFLRAALERAADGALTDGEDERLLFRALFIVGGRRDPLGFEPFLRFLRRPHDEVEFLLDDAVTEHLARIAAGVFDGKAEALFEAIADLTLDEYVRDALLGAATFLAWDGPIERERMVSFLRRFDSERL